MTADPYGGDLVATTWNIGDHGTEKDAIGLAESSDVVGLQEASDRKQLLIDLHLRGYGLIRPEAHVGQEATPLVFNPVRLQLRRWFSLPLWPGGDLGPGTGPDDGKPKWLNGGMFCHLATGRRVTVANLHAVAGQNHPERARIARRMVARAVRDLHARPGVLILLGDFNREANESTTMPLRRAGWECNQLHGWRYPTHGHWAPDQVWWRADDRIRLHNARNIRTGSDHHALQAGFLLTPRKGHTYAQD